MHSREARPSPPWEDCLAAFVRCGDNPETLTQTPRPAWNPHSSGRPNLGAEITLKMAAGFLRSLGCDLPHHAYPFCSPRAIISAHKLLTPCPLRTSLRKRLSKPQSHITLSPSPSSSSCRNDPGVTTLSSACTHAATKVCREVFILVQSGSLSPSHRDTQQPRMLWLLLFSLPWFLLLLCHPRLSLSSSMIPQKSPEAPYACSLCAAGPCPECPASPPAMSNAVPPLLCPQTLPTPPPSSHPPALALHSCRRWPLRPPAPCLHP